MLSEEVFVLMQSCPGEVSVHNLTLHVLMYFSMIGVYFQGDLFFSMTLSCSMYICVYWSHRSKLFEGKKNDVFCWISHLNIVSMGKLFSWLE